MVVDRQFKQKKRTIQRVLQPQHHMIGLLLTRTQTICIKSGAAAAPETPHAKIQSDASVVATTDRVLLVPAAKNVST